MRNEAGWFDKEENCTDSLNMQLANDATFVRAAFSNRLSILIQDLTAMIVTFVVGITLEWRVALIALATVPFLTISAVAQVCEKRFKLFEVVLYLIINSSSFAHHEHKFICDTMIYAIFLCSHY